MYLNAKGDIGWVDDGLLQYFCECGTELLLWWGQERTCEVCRKRLRAVVHINVWDLDSDDGEAE